MASKEFRSELFTEPSEYEETPLRDRKQKLYDLRHHREKAEFLRDVIALANTARMWGKPAYLLFGLDDNGNIHDITDDLKPYVSHLPSSDEEVVIAMEKVRHAIKDAISYYIDPLLILWNLEWGRINDSLVAYLRLEPEPTLEAFKVAKDLQSGGESLLREGEKWIRMGESKRKIEQQVLSRTSNYLDVPFIRPSMWLSYFEKLRSDPEIDKAARKRSYIELYTTEGESLKAIVEEFLRNDEAILVIEGSPGSGKSTFLRRIVAEWADAGIEAMQGIRRREEFKPPPGWIPVYFQLRYTRIEKGVNLAKEILREANSIGHFWEQEPSAPEKLLEDPALHWLICFDGLDELWEKSKVNNFLKALKALRRRYPRLKILLSTRPVFSIPDISNMRVVEIAPLSEGQIKQYLQTFINESNEPIYQQLEIGFSNPEADLYPLKDICSTPLYLEGLVSIINPSASIAETYLETFTLDEARQFSAPTAFSGGGIPKPLPIEEFQMLERDSPIEGRVEAGETIAYSEENRQQEEEFPPLTLGWVLARILGIVWEREMARRSIERIKSDRWWRATGELSLWIDGHRPFAKENKARKCYSSQEGLTWVLNLGILRSTKEGICFSHLPVQHYFGAEYLRIDPESISKWNRHCTPEFWQAVEKMLNEIS
jgi:hypothetical protein